jgi:hypothetical protein
MFAVAFAAGSAACEKLAKNRFHRRGAQDETASTYVSKTPLEVATHVRRVRQDASTKHDPSACGAHSDNSEVAVHP